MKRFMGITLMIAAVMVFFANPAYSQGKKNVTMTGTVIDTYCHVTMGMGGEAHKKCAEMCAKNGSPLSIKEEQSGTIYLAAGQKNMVYASAGLEKYVEEKVTVKGTVYEKDGVKMIVVDSVSPAK